MPKAKENTPIGLKLALLRKKRNISLDELSEKTGLKISHLERIEAGKDFAPVGDILRISRALTINPDELLSLHDEKKKDSAKKNGQGREELYQYTLLTPEVKDKHLRAFRVAIPANTEHPRVKYQHEGEELIYVLSGEVEVCVGQKSRLIRKNEAYLFDSGIKHTLKNNTSKETVLIVTVFTP